MSLVVGSSGLFVVKRVCSSPDSDHPPLSPSVVARQVIPGGAAATSGKVFENDTVLAIDGAEIRSRTSAEVAGLVLGRVGSAVTLHLSRQVLAVRQFLCLAESLEFLFCPWWGSGVDFGEVTTNRLLIP